MIYIIILFVGRDAGGLQNYAFSEAEIVAEPAGRQVSKIAVTEVF